MRDIFCSALLIVYAFQLIDLLPSSWSLAAHDVCFTRYFYGRLFSLGKIVPVVRGEGVSQPGMHFCLQRLIKGGWVHIFPEGKVRLADFAGFS